MDKIKKYDFIIHNNNFCIDESFIGKRLAFYNGQKYLTILIREEMCGRRLCEFFLTKRIGSNIHKKKRGKNR